MDKTFAGFALPNGVVFIGDKYTARCIYGKDNVLQLSYRPESRVFNLMTMGNALGERIKYVPFLSGLFVILGMIVRALVYSGIVGRSLIFFAILFQIEVFRLGLGKHITIDYLSFRLVLALLIVLGPLVLSKLNDGLNKNHGAEHKVINTVEAKKSLTIETIRNEMREHKRCGTNIIFVMTLVLAFIEFFGTATLFFSVMPLIISFVIASEFLKPTNPTLNKLNWKVGCWMQRNFTTAEPDDKQLVTAAVAMEALLRLEEFGELPTKFEILPDGWAVVIKQG